MVVGSNRPAGGRANKPMTRHARRSKDPSPVRGGREGRRPEGRRRSKDPSPVGGGRAGGRPDGWMGLCAAGSVWGSVSVHN